MKTSENTCVGSRFENSGFESVNKMTVERGETFLLNCAMEGEKCLWPHVFRAKHKGQENKTRCVILPVCHIFSNFSQKSVLQI